MSHLLTVPAPQVLLALAALGNITSCERDMADSQLTHRIWWRYAQIMFYVISHSNWSQQWLSKRELVLSNTRLIGAHVHPSVRDPLWDSTHVSNVSSSSHLSAHFRTLRDPQLPASSFYLSSMACDFLIAATQVYLFHKSRTGIGRFVPSIFFSVLLAHFCQDSVVSSPD